MSIEELALKAGIHQRTLRRLMNGNPAYLSTLGAIARSLGTPLHEIVDHDDLPRDRHRDAQSTFTLEFAVKGFSPDIHPHILLEATRRFTECVTSAGCTLSSVTSAMKVDDARRVIVMVYGLLEDGGPCWIYTAVRPSKYDSFTRAHQAGTLDLHAFDEYGEIIVSGSGRLPPNEVTRRVGELYSCSIPPLSGAPDS